MDIIINELAKAIQDGQMHIDDIPEVFKTEVARQLESEEEA